MKYVVQLESDEEGGFTVTVPSLPGCISEGETKEEALENIKEAIALYVEMQNEDLLKAHPNRIEVQVEA
ncbi:MAG: type II toxin-antitoxin system HicB family antitoxin [Methanoregula sp.]